MYHYYRYQQDYEQLGRAFCETLMDYYDDNPLKVNKIVKDIKKMRKEQRKARKALKAERMTELLVEKEKQNYSQEEINEHKKFVRFSLQDSFNWDEMEEELRKEDEENCDYESENDASDYENYL